MVMDMVGYRLYGGDTQFVEIEIDPGKAVVGESANMLYMEDGIAASTVLGDASSRAVGRGWLGKLLSVGKRLITGDSLFTTMYTNQSSGRRKLAFSAPQSGQIRALDLSQHGGTLMCQRSAFVCAARGLSMHVALQRKLGSGGAGAERFIVQKLVGEGMVFIQSSGCLLERELTADEALHVDIGCLVAYIPGTGFDLRFAGGKAALLVGKGPSFATLRGPGRVWLQSLPFTRLSSRLFAAAPASYGRVGRRA